MDSKGLPLRTRGGGVLQWVLGLFSILIFIHFYVSTPRIQWRSHKHPSCLILKWRSRSTLSSNQLNWSILFLRMSSVTQKRKLISAAFMQDWVISVIFIFQAMSEGLNVVRPDFALFFYLSILEKWPHYWEGIFDLSLSFCHHSGTNTKDLLMSSIEAKFYPHPHETSPNLCSSDLWV